MSARTGSRWSRGTSSNISSGGIAFQARRALELGDRVELVLTWPVPREDRTPVGLCLTGVVVRRAGAHTAVSFTAHRFVSATEAIDPALHAIA